MAKGKRMKDLNQKIEHEKKYSPIEALTLAKDTATSKFDESIDVSINLGVDPQQSDQAVRGATVLPNGTGKTIKVAVFAEGDAAKQAEKAGADIIGMNDLADSVKKGVIDFDVVIATPAAMRLVGQLGQILGPKGLMPNPKDSTVTENITKTVNDVKSGQVRYKSDKSGIIHCSIGKASFNASDLEGNLSALIEALKKAKPPSVKGIYLQRITVSATMGPSVKVDNSVYG
jgi:large subunit ribosomal protein L1